MKELANNFAELAAIIMLLITLAVSTAAVAEMFSGDETMRGGEAQSVKVAGL